MSGLLRTVEIGSLALWMLAAISVNLVFIPAVYLMITNRDEAEVTVGNGWKRLHQLGYLAGGIFLLASVARLGWEAGLVRRAALLVAGMLLSAVISNRWALPRMAALRDDMGSVSATPGHDPRRVGFDRLYRTSVRLEILVVLLGGLAFYLTIRGA